MTLLAACDQTATLHLCHIWIFKAQVSNCQQRNDGFKTIMDFRGSVITGVPNATITLGEALIVDYELYVILLSWGWNLLPCGRKKHCNSSSVTHLVVIWVYGSTVPINITIYWGVIQRSRVNNLIDYLENLGNIREFYKWTISYVLVELLWAGNHQHTRKEEYFQEMEVRRLGHGVF